MGSSPAREREVEEKSSSESPPPKRVSASSKLVRSLSSAKLAVSLLAVIGVILIVATVIKNQSRAYRYIYHSRWFKSLLGLFCLNLILCTARRWSFKVRRFGTSLAHAGVLVMVIGVVVGVFWGQRGVMKLHIGHSDDICKGEYVWDGGTYDIEQAKEKKEEYESRNLDVAVEPEKGKYLLYTRPAKKFTLPFTVHLEDFEVERYHDHVLWEALEVQVVDRNEAQRFPIEPGKEFQVADTPYTVTIVRYEPDFVILGEGRYGSRSNEPKNPALQVRVDVGERNSTTWVFAKFPGMHLDPESNVRLFYWRVAKIKAFKSKVQLFDGGKVVASKTIEVNKPLKYQGYSIYQSSYDRDYEQFSVFEIARDPGVPLVYLGFLTISAGVMYSFYLRPLLIKRARVLSTAREVEESNEKS